MNKDNAVKSSNGLWNTILLVPPLSCLYWLSSARPNLPSKPPCKHLSCGGISYFRFAFSRTGGNTHRLWLGPWGWRTAGPFDEKIFKLPGAGGWVLITGMTAGFPASAGRLPNVYTRRASRHGCRKARRYIPFL